MRTCSTCNTEKPEEDFYSYSKGNCKKCQSIASEAWRQNNLEKTQAYQREYQKKYTEIRKARRHAARDQRLAEKLRVAPEQEAAKREKMAQMALQKAEDARKREERLRTRNEERLALREQKKQKREEEAKKLQEKERERREKEKEARDAQYLKNREERLEQRRENHTNPTPPASLFGTQHLTPVEMRITKEQEFSPNGHVKGQLKEISDYFNGDFMIFDPALLLAIKSAKLKVEEDHETRIVTITYSVSKRKRMYSEDLILRRSTEDKPPRGLGSDE